MSSSTLLAIRMFCCDYHDGQTSRFYRLQCRIKRHLERRGVETYRALLTAEELAVYRRLEQKYVPQSVD